MYVNIYYTYTYRCTNLIIPAYLTQITFNLYILTQSGIMLNPDIKKSRNKGIHYLDIDTRQ